MATLENASGAAAPLAPVGRLYGAYVVGVMFLAWLTSYLDRQVISVLVPSLKAGMALSDTQVSLLQGVAFSSCFAVAGLPLGHLADRVNRRNLIAAGIASWTIANIGCGLAASFWQLFAARMAVGVGEACLAPACVSMLTDYFHPEVRGRALGIAQAGTPVGNALAMFLGGYLLTAFAHGDRLLAWVPAGWAGWKVVFVLIGACGIPVALLAATLKEPARTQGARPAGERGENLVRFLRRRWAVVAAIYGIFTCLFVHGYAINAWAPTLLMRIYRYSPAQAGGAFGLILLIGSSSGGLASGFLSDALARWRPQDGRVLIPLLLLPVEIPLLVALLFSQSATLTIAILGVSAFVTGLLTYNVYSILQEIAPGHLRGKVVALYLLVANFVGLGLAPTCVALVTDRLFRDEMMLQKSISVVALAGCALGLILAIPAPRLFRDARTDP